MITVVGEALIDLVQSPTGADAAHPGGSPANVAVGLGRLGNEVSLLTRYGRDAHGSALAFHFAASDVHLVGDPRDELPTSFAIARTDRIGAATYEFAIDWRLPVHAETDIPPGTTCLHTGSIAATLLPGATSVRALVEQARGRCTVSYDPNCRPTLMGSPDQARARIEELVALSDVVKVSDEDLAWLHPGREAVDVAHEWLALGPALVVVTRGASGALGLCAQGAVQRPAPGVEVADTVGAGDAFMSGLLDALNRSGLLGHDNSEALRQLRADQLAEVLDEASLVSAITCSRSGANPPTLREVTAYRSERQARRP